MTSRVLIIEDNRDSRESLKTILESHYPDIVIAEAETGAEALRQIGLFRPEIVFVDIHLPGGLNGLELVKRIRRHDPRIRIAVITSHDLPEYRSASLRLGANHFIPKSSVSRADILAVMREMIRP